jgi:SAM-dependent methyltransferase
MRVLLKSLLLTLNRIGNSRHCPLCGWRGLRFLPFGDCIKWRMDVRCPQCRSVERHRLAYLLLHERLTGPHRTLHVAPEPSIASWLRQISSDYLSIDLYAPAMRKMDLTSLELPNASMSLVWCSHVLEHIPEDQAAIREIFRVLSPCGIAVLQVPILPGPTFEDPSITDPEERRRYFYQHDHVRNYGLDFVDRLVQCGFHVEVLHGGALSKDALLRCRTSYAMTNEIFFCQKPAH